jgi:two-component system sensor histidine kinase KdpD
MENGVRILQGEMTHVRTLKQTLTRVVGLGRRGGLGFVSGYLAAVAGVAAMTGLIGLIRDYVQIPNIFSLYLIVVLAVAVVCGGGPAIAASVLAFLSFDWFFIPPFGDLSVSNSDEWLALILFLVTAVVTSQLAAAQRRRAAEAQRREREAIALYGISSVIAREADPARFIPEIAEKFADELALAGVAVLVPDEDCSWRIVAEWGARMPESPTDRSVADWVLRHGQSVSLGGSHGRWRALELSGDVGRELKVVSPSADWEADYIQLRGSTRAVGVLRVLRTRQSPEMTAEQRRLLEVTGQQIGIALERARLQAEAAEAVALRRADEMKNALLSSVSHDLRTPLALIKAAAGSLRQRDAEWSVEERDEFAKAIEQDVDRLDRIVGNLLDVSQIEAGALNPDRQYYPLATLVDDVLGRLGPILATHPLSVDVPEDLPLVYVDYVAIDRVLSNLLENVERHTPPGTMVSISAHLTKEGVVVTVADNGPGIPPPALPRVFDKFYRGPRQAGASSEGSGLGLAVVKGLVEAHQGKIWVENQPQGGAAFSFSLPVTRESGVGSREAGPWISDQQVAQ